MVGTSQHERMRGTRPAAVAGFFYPGERAMLERTVGKLLEEAAEATPSSRALPKAVIAPHAGYRYSGPIAARAFDLLHDCAGRIERVILLGPSHRVAFRGLALPAADHFATPLGEVPLDLEAATALLTLPEVKVDPAPHAREHGLEVELPFLQRILGRFELVPLVVGDAAAETVAAVLEEVWDGAETLIVISSDLSHFLTYDEARRVDHATAEAVTALRAPIHPQQACGALALNGLLTVAQRRGLAAELVDLRNSGDTAGDRQRVVGYGAFSFSLPPEGAADA